MIMNLKKQLQPEQYHTPQQSIQQQEMNLSIIPPRSLLLAGRPVTNSG